MRTRPLSPFALPVLCLSLTACATAGAGGGHGSQLYAMPSELGEAIPPEDADPASAAELAESALYLLDPSRPSGPDYLGAARMCLLATEVADPDVEDDLVSACFRVAARSALRAGDRDLYVETVDIWEERAPRSQQRVGELAVHRSLRDRLRGREPRYDRRLPTEVRTLVPEVESGS